MTTENKTKTVPRFINSFIPKHYDLHLELNNIGKIFSGTVLISGLKKQKNISLHTSELEIKEVLINNKPASFSFHEYDELRLETENTSEEEVEISLTFSGKITDAMHGLYPCYFKQGEENKNLLATQFESHHAREVFPCVDEPEAKATFDLTLNTETGVQVLSNMPAIKTTEKDERLITTFSTTPKMSTYLLAFVVGELQVKTAKTKSGVEVNIFATHTQSAESLDFALEHSVKSIEFFEDYFGVPYPLPKSDQVALPDFAFGAMENWGLVTYRETALLADPKNTTLEGKKRIAIVISHELSHQWFGNLVTMRWWNNLWLNESFATLMEYIAVDAIKPEWNIWQKFATSESVIALRRDAISGVQAVQVEVNHPDEISTLFDGAIVYAKGARLMRMLQEYIGDEAFRKGLKNYFTEFQYKNTEATDLWQHLEKASGKNISEMMNVWISTSGYPVLHTSQTGVKQEQFFIGEHEKSVQTWPIPLSSTNKNHPELLLEKQAEFTITNSDRFNIKDSAHFITNYETSHFKEILKEISNIDVVGRLQILHERTLLARGGVISFDDLIDLLLAYKEETEADVWNIINLTFSELKKFVENDKENKRKLKDLAFQLANPLFSKLGFDKKLDETENDTKLRPILLSFLIYSKNAEIITETKKRFAEGIENIDSEIRALIIGATVQNTEDIKVIEDLFTYYKNSSSAQTRSHITAGLIKAKQTTHIDLILSNLVNKDIIRPQDISFWFSGLINNKHARKQTWQWMEKNWQWIEDSFGGSKDEGNFPRIAATCTPTSEYLENYRAFFSPMLTTPSLTRTIEMGLKELEGQLALLEKNKEKVYKKLATI